ACVRAGLRPNEPVDLGPNATDQDFADALDATLADDSVDSLVVVFIPALAPISSGVAEVLRERSARSAKPIVTAYLGHQGIPEELRLVGEDGGTRRGSGPSYAARDAGVRALAR